MEGADNANGQPNPRHQRQLSSRTATFEKVLPAQRRVATHVLSACGGWATKHLDIDDEAAEGREVLRCGVAASWTRLCFNTLDSRLSCAQPRRWISPGAQPVSRPQPRYAEDTPNASSGHRTGLRYT